MRGMTLQERIRNKQKNAHYRRGFQDGELNAGISTARLHTLKGQLLDVANRSCGCDCCEYIKEELRRLVDQSEKGAGKCTTSSS